MVEYLAQRYELDVIAFREPDAPDPRAAFPVGLVRSIQVVDLPFHARSTPARAWRNLNRLVRDVPPLIDRFSGFDLPITRKYDLAVIEHFWCAPYLDELRRRCDRVVLNLHNIESTLLNRCAETESLAGRMALRRFGSACRTLESELLPRFDNLLVTSESDRRQVGSGIVWPNTIPFKPRPQVPPRPDIVFSGNMAYHPNRAAVRFFAADIWPRVRERAPDLTWRLVGKNPEALGLNTDLTMRVVGPVSDAIAALSGSCVAVVPLLSGSGTRFKILEAWAAGVPVVSTTIGAEGLNAVDGEHLLIADKPDDFANAVLSIVNNHRLAGALADCAREFYESNFTWPIAWKTLEEAGL
jgi:glycosyltransferase involved in cell wall biosynthesis